MDKTCRTVQEEVLYLNCIYLSTLLYSLLSKYLHMYLPGVLWPRGPRASDRMWGGDGAAVWGRGGGGMVSRYVKCHMWRAAGLRDRGQDGVRGCGEGGLHHHAGGEVQPRHGDGECHVSRVSCHVYRVTCIMSRVTILWLGVRGHAGAGVRPRAGCPLQECHRDQVSVIVRTGNILIQYCCRFDEKCWVEEESSCRTVYDTVWENKCEMVSANKL